MVSQLYSGRMRRVNFALFAALYSFLFFIWRELAPDFKGFTVFMGYLVLVILFSIPSAKRCHDIGWSGWYQFIPGASLLLLFMDSQPGDNEYGPNPKGVEVKEPDPNEEPRTIFSFSARQNEE